MAKVYFIPFQVAVEKDEPLSNGGEIVILLNREGVKKFSGTTKVKEGNVIKIRCTVDGTTYGSDLRLNGTVEDNIIVKDGSDTIKVNMTKTSEFSFSNF